MKKASLLWIFFGIALFFLVGFIALNGYCMGFDTGVYNLLHTLPEYIVDPFFKTITCFGNTDVVIVLVILLSVILYKSSGVYILLISLIDVVLNQSLKLIFKRPRPEFVHLVHAGGYSYPSGHTMIAIVLYGFLCYLILTSCKNKWIRGILSFICIFLMICIPLSRVYLGVHFSTDIIGGSIIGWIILYSFITWHKKRIN